ncbi:MAG: aldo/keto reductase, partial [Actinomycetes bacterium]
MTMTDYAEPAATLDQGAMPLLGFGTWEISDAEAPAATTTALEVGYRHLDTATVYRNEAGIGRALASAGLPRESLFVTTKLPPDRGSRARQTLEASLA